MTSVMRWIGRTLFLLGIAGLLACGGFLVWFSGQRNAALQALDAGSQLATTQHGPVEFVEAGPPDGIPVLVLHGTPGGYDQALAIGRDLIAAGYRVIAPSRPGYLRTPLTTGLTFDEQGNAMVALLDTLGKSDVAVVGYGAGASVAIEMARLHPSRVRGIVLYSPVNKPSPPYNIGNPPENDLLAADVLRSIGGDLGSWFFVREMQSDPKRLMNGVFRRDTTLPEDGVLALSGWVAGHSGQLALMTDLVKSTNPVSPREVGSRNDLTQLRSPSTEVAAPVFLPSLVITGSADRARAFTDVPALTQGWTDVQTQSVADSGSLVWFGANGAGLIPAVTEFIRTLPPPLPGE